MAASEPRLSDADLVSQAISEGALRYPLAVGQVYERAPMLCRDGTRVDLGGTHDHKRIRLAQVPGGRKRTIRYAKVKPKAMGNGRPDRGEHPITVEQLARHYRFVGYGDDA